jgi:hypothetical protein
VDCHDQVRHALAELLHPLTIALEELFLRDAGFPDRGNQVRVP